MRTPKRQPAQPIGDRHAIEHWGELLPLADFLPLNVGLRSAQEQTMISLLGSPRMPLTTHDQPDRASDLVKRLAPGATRVTSNIQVRGIKPAVESLTEVLNKVLAEQPGLEDILNDNGMLVVRLRRPTSGAPSTQISNHSWGTALDFRLVGMESPTNTHDKVPRFIAVMLSAFNKAGWFSGIAFHDTMHFEVADQTMHKWANDGRFAL